MIDGILPVLKPRGLVSKDVSRRLQKVLPRGTRLGHVGTLDPLASGLLPILLGRATRLQDSLLVLPKRYRCSLALGYETDTLDADGKVCLQLPWQHLSLDDLQRQAASMCGESLQVPPLYSAVKYKGRPLYAYARAGEEVDRQALARPIWVEEFKILALEGDRLDFELSCSKGTYVRELGQRLLRSLGSCGTVVALERTLCAGLDLTKGLALERVLEDVSGSCLSLEHGCVSLPSLGLLDSSDVLALQSGRRLQLKLEKIQLMSEYERGKGVLWDQTGRVFGLGQWRFLSDFELEIGMQRSLV